MKIHPSHQKVWWGELNSVRQRGSRDDQVTGFKDQFFRALSEVNQTQLHADRMAEHLAAGEVEDLSQVMLATEKANLSMLLTLRMRNQALDAYKEIMRMQV